jgi:Holliday junction resolvasome RuvABC endonuclease subunit
MNDDIMSFDPGVHTGWATISRDRNKTLGNFGLIKFENEILYFAALTEIINKQMPAQFVIEEPSHEMNLSTFSKLRDKYAIIKLACMQYSVWHSKDNRKIDVDSCKVFELKQLWKGLRRGMKKEQAIAYVKARYHIDKVDNNIADAIVLATFWLDKKELVLAQRVAREQKKTLLRKLRKEDMSFLKLRILQ